MYLESTEQATTSVSIAWNSSRRSLNASISVGHTNVLRRGGIFDRERRVKEREGMRERRVKYWW